MVAHSTFVGGTSIHWVEEGVGDPPLLLIHGWGSSVVKWMDVLPLLGASHRTIALDLPGFGRSSIPRATYSPAWLAGAVRAFMDATGIERAILVGNSLGGLVATHAAAAWPERVAGVVLVSPALPSEGPPPSARVLASLVAPALPGLGEVLYRRHVARRSPERLVAESLERNCHDPVRVAPATVRALEDEARARRLNPAHVRPVVLANRRMVWELSARRERTWSVVRAVRAPALIVWGGQDRLLSPRIGERAVREIPGAELVVMDECGHNPQLEKPADFAAIVGGFARALR